MLANFLGGQAVYNPVLTYTVQLYLIEGVLGVIIFVVVLSTSDALVRDNYVKNLTKD